MRIGRTARAVIAACSGAASLLAAPASAGDIDSRLYERSFMLAAHQRCGLFDARLAQALGVAALQARGAALLHGRPEAEVTATAVRARAQAGRTTCRNPDLAVARDRVKSAFDGLLKTPRMTFPGARREWRADRYARPISGWRLMQASSVGASPVTLGMGEEGGLSAVVSWDGRPRPYAARIVARDTARDARPWLAEPNARAPRQAVWASSWRPAPAKQLVQGRRTGEAWMFPVSAADAIAALDPRETFTVEFIFRDDSIARVRFEAGDFAAARAFVGLGVV